MTKKELVERLSEFSDDEIVVFHEDLESLYLEVEKVMRVDLVPFSSVAVAFNPNHDEDDKKFSAIALCFE